MTQEEMIKNAEKMRLAWKENDAKRDEGLTEPSDVEKLTDICYDTKSDACGRAHLLDIYYPKGEKRDRPTIVNVHGGGWFYCYKELYRFYCMWLAREGFHVVNFNYRLAPEYKYPSAIEDVCKVMNFLKEKGKEYHISTKELFMVGDSAGAQLTSQYGVIASNVSYREKLPFETSDVKPKGIALNCGIYEMKDLADDEIRKWYQPEPFPETLRQSFLNILDYVDETYPPTYLMLSVNDPLKVHSKAMKDKLEEKEIPMCFREFGAGHPESGHVFHVDMKNPESETCNLEECAFFKRLIK